MRMHVDTYISIWNNIHIAMHMDIGTSVWDNIHAYWAEHIDTLIEYHDTILYYMSIEISK